MHIKFKITFDDGSVLESHDNMWNLVADHCNALPPFTDKKWLRYELISDDLGELVGVDFTTGLFSIRGSLVHVGSKSGEALTFQEGAQEFLCEPNRQHFNQLAYFPIFGRRRFSGDWGETVLYLVGWKRKIGKKTVEHVAYVYPNGQIVLT